jgi:hypothetical protein
MKKALVLIIAIALVLWVVSWFRTPETVATSAAQPWPGDMGALGDAGRRFPPAQANEASRQLMTLAGKLPKDQAVDDFVAREIARGELAIGEPPALPDLSMIRSLLLREPILWERREGFDDAEVIARRPLQMALARTLVATALAKARQHDSAAWEDLHAVWNLARSLDGHPQMMAQTAALTMARMVNAVAWKMPLHPPAWLGELQERDNVRRLLDAFQYQTASYWQSGAQMFPTTFLATSIEHDRRIAEELFKVTGCDVTMPMNKLGPDLSSVWRRAFRFRAEREASANALRVREGKPIETKSVCSDGTWSLEGTTLRFSREIPSGTSEQPMPLVLNVAQERR